MTTMLRNQWSSDAIIQTDCCDRFARVPYSACFNTFITSVSTIASMKYKNLSPSEALALVSSTSLLLNSNHLIDKAVNDGLGIYFGFRVGSMRQYMQDNLVGREVLLSYSNHLIEGQWYHQGRNYQSCRAGNNQTCWNLRVWLCFGLACASVLFPPWFLWLVREGLSVPQWLHSLELPGVVLSWCLFKNMMYVGA